jgi:hypothetical protein
MAISKTIIRLAEEEALSSFTDLAAGIVTEADASLNQAALSAPSAEQRVLSGARAFLRDENRMFQSRMTEAYAGFLVRAMQTMHKDLRTGYRDISADTLTLIDDEVVTRQIEVDRLVQRLRDADPINLARLNLMIAQIHGEYEVRERENPFRPYLLARALHEALREMVADEARSKVLFDHLSTAMSNQLSLHYGAIHDVFEARGIHARLQPRPSDMSRAERDRLAWKKAADQMLGRVEAAAAGAGVLTPQARMLPALKNLAEHGSTPVGQSEDLQNLVWNVFNQPKAGRMSQQAQALEEAPRLPIDAQLMQMQKSILAQKTDGPQMTPLDLREQINEATAGTHDGVTVDLVALLFEFIVHDDSLPEAVRKELGRLQLPFLRAALAQPTLLHDAQHPARRLLDRIGTIAANIDVKAPEGEEVTREIVRTLEGVLAGFDSDVAVFADGEAALDAFIATRVRRNDSVASRCADALDAAEASAQRGDASAIVLKDLLAPLQVDPRLAVFLSDTWAMVLADAQADETHLALVSELVWSAQEKTGPDERAALMRMLPGLVPRVRAGLAMAGVPEELAKSALDGLVAVHMDVLGNRAVAPARMNLEALRTHFAVFPIRRASAMQAAAKPEPLRREGIEAALGAAGIPATIHAEPVHIITRPSHEAWLAWSRPGAGFEFMVEGKYVPIKLGAVTRLESAYIFMLDGQSQPIVYTQAALLTAMHATTLRTVEYAPLFDRAVESLMVGAQALAPPEK